MAEFVGRLRCRFLRSMIFVAALLRLTRLRAVTLAEFPFIFFFVAVFRFSEGLLWWIESAASRFRNRENNSRIIFSWTKGRAEGERSSISARTNKRDSD